MAQILINTELDFNNLTGIKNLAAATANGEPVVYEQLDALLAALSWKDNVRVAAQVNTTISSPGSTIDGITMATNDRVLLFNQTTVSQNGIYIWNGSSTAMTRSADATVFSDLESAVVTVDEGTSAGVAYRQTQVNGTIGSSDNIWGTFGTSPLASTSTAGLAKLATQSQVNTGTSTDTIVTPATLASYTGLLRKYSVNIGDSSSTSIVVTHNLNTLDVEVYVRETSGSFREVICEKQHTGVNAVTLVFATAPGTNAYRAIVIG
jgi:hypothetical protein